jgi:NADPH:quinone reductase-like Zn-dependent oxidoreductase
VDVALDTVGTDEAIDVSLAVVADKTRIVTIASPRAESAGIRRIGGAQADSAAFRAAVRPRLLALAAEGKLVIPVAKTFPLAEAKAALELLKSGHPGGKLALIP